MSEFVSAAVPFVQWRNRHVLTDEQLAEDPCLREFVQRFSNCFEYDPAFNVWVYAPAE